MFIDKFGLNSRLKKLLLCSRIREITALGSPVTLKDITYISWLLSGLVWLMYGSSHPSDRRISAWRRIFIFPLFSLLLRFIIEVKRLFNHCSDRVWPPLRRVARSAATAKAQRDVAPGSEDARQNMPVVKKGISGGYLSNFLL